MLENNVKRLEQMYQQIVSQHTAMTVDLQLKDQNISRKAKRIMDYEKQITTLKDDFKNLKSQCDALKDIIKLRVPGAEEILAQPVFTQVSPTYASQNNVVIPLKGGGGNIAQ